MNSSSDVNTLACPRSKLFKRFAAFAAALLSTTSLVLPCLASSVDTTDWETVDATPYLFYCEDESVDTSFTQVELGDYIHEYFIGQESVISLTTGMKLYRGTTYQITFTAYLIDFSRLTGNFCITDRLPDDTIDLAVQTNSDHVQYIDLVDISAEYKSNSAYRYTITFSTADGYIDNFENGYKYVSLSFYRVTDIWTEAELTINISDLSVSCIVDPTAEYYRASLIDDLNDKADRLKETYGELQSHENWALTRSSDFRSSASEQMKANLQIAKNFVSPVSRSGGSIATAAAATGALLTDVTSVMPANVQTLIVVIPLLAFIGWVIGRVT